MAVGPDGAQERDRKRSRADAALDDRRARIDVAPYEERSRVFRIDDLGGARQMRDQVGVGGAQDKESLAAAEFYPRALVQSEEGLGRDIAANQELLMSPQDLQVAAAFAVDEENGIVFFKRAVHAGLAIDAWIDARNHERALRSLGWEVTIDSMGWRRLRWLYPAIASADVRIVKSSGRVILYRAQSGVG